jgi:hypothetical protein
MSAPTITRMINPMITIEHLDTSVRRGRRAQSLYCAAAIVGGAMRFRLLRPTLYATASFAVRHLGR